LSNIADYTTKLSPLETADLDRKLVELKKVFFDALYLRSQLSGMLEIQESKYPDPRENHEIFIPYKIVVNSVLATLEEKIQECLIFRRQPIAHIVGRDGVEQATLPKPFPYTEWEMKVVDGILGKIYLESPTTLGSVDFPGLHYIGFAIPVEGGFKPWMAGSLVTDKADEVVASAKTPEKLRRDAFAALNNVPKPRDPEYIMYGETVYLQTMKEDWKWLENKAYQKDVTAGNLTDTIYQQYYQWYFEKKGDVGSIDHVRYGDTIFVQNEGTERWLFRPTDEFVDHALADRSISSTSSAAYDWIVRSTRADHDTDPSLGEIVKSEQVVLLQNAQHPSDWLGWSEVTTDLASMEYLESIKPPEYPSWSNIVQQNVATFEQFSSVSPEWIIRTESGPGTRIDALECAAKTVRGTWRPVVSASASSNEVTVWEGFREDDDTGGTSEEPALMEWSQPWVDNVMDMVLLGFEYGHNFEHESDFVEAVPVVLSMKRVIDQSKKSSIVTKKENEQVWQFVVEIDTLCDASYAFLSDEIVITDSADQDVCCLPTFFLNDENPHGSCETASVCMCASDICKVTLDQVNVDEVKPQVIEIKDFYHETNYDYLFKEDEGSANTGPVVIIIVGVVVGTAFFALFGVWWFRRTSNKKVDEPEAATTFDL
jgi:hypothetical protein